MSKEIILGWGIVFLKNMILKCLLTKSTSDYFKNYFEGAPSAFAYGSPHQSSIINRRSSIINHPSSIIIIIIVILIIIIIIIISNHSSLIIHHPSCIIHHSSLIIHHSYSIIHYLLFIIHRSSFIVTVHQPSSIIHHHHYHHRHHHHHHLRRHHHHHPCRHHHRHHVLKLWSGSLRGFARGYNHAIMKKYSLYFLKIIYMYIYHIISFCFNTI